MRKELLISFLIVAFLNFITGCTITNLQTIPPEELISGQEEITEVVLLNGNIIRFESPGGIYIESISYITGNLRDGKEFKKPLNQISQFRTSSPAPVLLKDLNKRPIKEILLPGDVLVIFNSDGAVYDSSSGVISGVTLNGEKFLTSQKDLIIFTENAEVIKDYELDSSTILTQVILKNINKSVYFNEEGGRYESGKRVIRGISVTKNLENIDPDSTQLIRIDEVNQGLSIFTSILLGGAIIVVVGYIIVAALFSNAISDIFND